jgi:hypothetical protein
VARELPSITLTVACNGHSARHGWYSAKAWLLLELRTFIYIDFVTQQDYLILLVNR